VIEKTGGILRDLLLALEKTALSLNVRNKVHNYKILEEDIQIGLIPVKEKLKKDLLNNIDSERLLCQLEDICKNKPTYLSVCPLVTFLTEISALIEYKNGSAWYGIHPLVVDILKELKRI
jgi:hypothetical protein